MPGLHCREQVAPGPPIPSFSTIPGVQRPFSRDTLKPVPPQMVQIPEHPPFVLEQGPRRPSVRITYLQSSQDGTHTGGDSEKQQFSSLTALVHFLTLHLNTTEWAIFKRWRFPELTLLEAGTSQNGSGVDFLTAELQGSARRHVARLASVQT